MIVISPGTYRGASFGLNVCGPIMLPAPVIVSESCLGLAQLTICNQVHGGNSRLLRVAGDILGSSA